ncbi:GNAT family N-acetyltransferase [Kroppenstedtia sanguinis]|uniref:GNAT family N-acetyltransferase n=1 Tax=Kroppenstedtia sanguinis TaxID=1380684 RepID=A0ABW4CD27_9BACL
MDFFHCLPYGDNTSHTGFFGMSVSQPWRGRGVGSALLQTLLDWAETHPTIEKVCLEVFADNDRAISLYHRLGFQEEGRWNRQVKTGEGKYVDLLQMGPVCGRQ